MDCNSVIAALLMFGSTSATRPNNFELASDLSSPDGSGRAVSPTCPTPKPPAKGLADRGR